MAECNSPYIYPSLNDQQQFTLNKISEVKSYFIRGFRERKLVSKRFSKNVACFDCFNKSLIVLSEIVGIISIASLETVVGVPVGIASSSFSLAPWISTAIVKQLLKTTQNKKKKVGKTTMLARSKLNTTERKILEELLNSEISHEEFTIIVNKKNYCYLIKGFTIMKRQISDTEKLFEWRS